MTNALAIIKENVPSVEVKTKDKNVDEDCIAFGKRLAKAMDDAEITQADLARMMGMSRSGVNWWIQGLTYPAVEKAKRIAGILRVTPEYLIYGVVRPKSKERLMENIPVYDAHINGMQHNVSQLGLPKDFIARIMPDAKALKGVELMTNDKGIKISIADTSDREITEEPKTMLIDFGDRVKPVSVMKADSLIVMQTTDNGLVSMSEGDFFQSNLVLGHVRAELTTGRD